MIGRVLSHYRILEKLGAGGMGEVYLAHDMKLDRNVAIKILPVGVADDPDRLARLRREAQVLAALNHPNIAAIYELAEFEQHCFLALEFVAGPTLEQRLARGPLPWREALDVCRQIAVALGAAHEKGIVHRDLKPANVKVTPDGRVKLLDFGLAKTNLGGPPGSDPGQLSTVTNMTEPGAILGTMPYMSPEQARAQAVTSGPTSGRLDASFMKLCHAAGSSGNTGSDILAAILRDRPKLDGLPAETPAGVRLILERCLRPDLNRRLQDIGDARIEIEDTLSDASITAPATKPAGSRLLWMLAGGLLASAFFVSWWLRFQPATTAVKEVQFQRITDFVGKEDTPAISPDGKTVAFTALFAGKMHIWLRLLSGGTPLRITQDDLDHLQPRWAPDSSSLIYFSPSATPGQQGALWEISALGGVPRRIGSALGGADISHNGGRITYFRLQSERIELVAATRDNSAVQVIKPLAPENIYDSPRWSPDDRAIAFERSAAVNFETSIRTTPVQGGEERKIASGATLRGFSWLPNGSGLVYASALGSTVSYPPTFNLRTVGRDGSADRQLTFGDVSYVNPDVGKSGKLAASRIRSQSDLWKFPVTGSAIENSRTGIRITRQTAQVQTPSMSPDETELAYLSDSGGHGNIFAVKRDGSGVRQLTFESDPSVSVGVPVWSPAGNQILFILAHAGYAAQWLVDRDGSGMRQFLPQGVWAYWSGDGRWLYYGVNRKGVYCIEKIPTAGGMRVQVRCDDALAPAVSADGSTLYYVVQVKGGTGWDFELRRARPESGPSEILARIAGSRIPVDPGNIHAILSPDEKWLALPLTNGATTNLWGIPAAGGPMRQLTDFGDRPIVIARRVSWSRDSRFIYAAVAESDADIVILNGLLQ